MNENYYSSTTINYYGSGLGDEGPGRLYRSTDDLSITISTIATIITIITIATIITNIIIIIIIIINSITSSSTINISVTITLIVIIITTTVLLVALRDPTTARAINVCGSRVCLMIISIIITIYHDVFCYHDYYYYY